MAAITSFQVSAHGWVDYPKARQTVCREDDGHWGPDDGSAIPNAACRASFLESGTYPVVQINEYAALVPDHTNMESVKAAVPDGLICSGGDDRKSGMSVASADWQREDMKAGETFTMRYRATAPHNPSYWEFYLTKPGYNAAHSRLTWDDLELFDTAGNIEYVQESDGKYYYIDVTLPAGRTGEATLMTRWQREDPAGEGFYNCSDIRFDDEVTPPEWTSKGTYVKPGVVAEEGDAVWFRIFSGTGNEVVFEKFPITASNQDVNVWSYELAQLINEKYPTITQVGLLQESGDIVYENADLHINNVYVTNANYNYALDVRDGTVDPAPVEVTGLQSEYTQDSEGVAHIEATVSSEGHYDIKMELLDQNGSQIGTASDVVNNGQVDLLISANQVGEFTINVTAAEFDSSEYNVIVSQPVTIKEAASGDYDYVYPDGIGSYEPEKTVVLSRDGNTYKCRKEPQGNWCNINSPIHYEPGFGSAWQDAWIKL